MLEKGQLAHIVSHSRFDRGSKLDKIITPKIGRGDMVADLGGRGIGSTRDQQTGKC
jgi:hypothetical protein